MLFSNIWAYRPLKRSLLVNAASGLSRDQVVQMLNCKGSVVVRTFYVDRTFYSTTQYQKFRGFNNCMNKTILKLMQSNYQIILDCIVHWITKIKFRVDNRDIDGTVRPIWVVAVVQMVVVIQCSHWMTATIDRLQFLHGLSDVSKHRQ